MRWFVVVVTMLAGCLMPGGGGDDGGGGSPTSKHWRSAQTSLEDQQTSFAFGAGDALFSLGLNTKHMFALDPATLLYDDYGVPPVQGSLASGDGGVVYLVASDRFDVYRLDGRAWTKIGTAPSAHITIGPGDSVYDADADGDSTVITRHPVGDWDASHRETVATVPGHFVVGFDARGHTVLQSHDDQRIAGTLQAGAFVPYYACGTVQQLWCTNGPADPELDDAGTLTFMTVNDITGSRIYRKAAGADPIEAAPMPTPDHDNAYHVFGTSTTADGTRYLAYGGNDIESPHFYVLAPGASKLAEGDQLPDSAYGFFIAPRGTLYSMSNGPIRAWVLK